MPMIHLTLPSGVLAAGNRQKLRATLEATLLKWEGAPDIAFFRTVAWTRLDELPTDAIRGDEPESLPVHLAATVPAGVISDRRKVALIDDLTTAVRTFAEPAVADRLQIRVLVNEQPEGTWGVGGHIVPFREIASTTESLKKLRIRRLAAGLGALTRATVEQTLHRRGRAAEIGTAAGNQGPVIPMVHLTLPTGVLTDLTRQSLRNRLASTVGTAGEAPFDELSTIWIDEADIFGSTADALPRFRLDVAVPAGLLSARHKATLIRDLTADIRLGTGTTVTGSRIWVLIHEGTRGVEAAADQSQHCRGMHRSLPSNS